MCMHTTYWHCADPANAGQPKMYGVRVTGANLIDYRSFLMLMSLCSETIHIESVLILAAKLIDLFLISDL